MSGRARLRYDRPMSRPRRTPALPLALVLLVATAALVLAAAPPAGVFLPGTQPADGSGDPGFPAFANHDEPGLLATASPASPPTSRTTPGPAR